MRIHGGPAALVIVGFLLVGCDSLFGPEAPRVGSFEIILTPDLNIGVAGQIKELVLATNNGQGLPIEGLDVSVTIQAPPTNVGTGFELGSSREGPFGASSVVPTDSAGESLFFLRYPSHGTGKIGTLGPVILEATHPARGLKVASARFIVTVLPFAYEAEYLGDFQPVAINNRSQVLGNDVSTDTKEVVVVDPDGTLHRMPGFGEETLATSISDFGTVVGRTESGMAFTWEPGGNPEVLSTVRSNQRVWISSNGLVLADTLLWRGGVPERLPREPSGIRWTMVNARAEVGGSEMHHAWIWDGTEVQQLYDASGQLSAAGIMDMADSGEILISPGHCCFLVRATNDDVREGPTIPWRYVPIHGGARGARINSVGTLLSYWIGLGGGELRVAHGGVASLHLYLQASGHAFSTSCPESGWCFDINDLGEIVIYGTVDGQGGAYLMRPSPEGAYLGGAS